MAESTGIGTPQVSTGNADPNANEESRSNEHNEISGRFKKMEKQSKDLREALSSLQSSMPDLIAQAVAQALEAGKPKPPPNAEGTPNDIENHPLFKGMLKQVSELKETTAQAKAESDAKTAKIRDRDLRQKLTEKLAAAGIEGFRAQKAIGDLVDASKQVRYSSAQDEDIVFGSNDDDSVDLDTGLTTWLKTEAGKFYLPPRGAAGSGDGPGGRNPNRTNSTQPMSREELAQQFMAKLQGHR